MRRSSTFPRSARLTSGREITAVLRRPTERIQRKAVQILAVPNTLGHARLGVIVGRRYDRRSTRRNEFKRCVREAFRQARSTMSEVDIVVRAGQAVAQTELNRELEKAFTKFAKKPHAWVEKNQVTRQPVRLRIAIGAIKAYRLVLSPMLGGRCRFHPTCSSYALQALEERGLVKGLALSLARIAKCHPFHRGGYDPVPSALRDS